MVYRLFSYLYPRALRTRYVALLGYAHIKVEPLRFLGFILFFGLGLALALAFFVAALFPVPFWRIFLSAFVIFEVGFYMWLALRVDAKAKFVEEVLPDALRLMASNLHAGLTIDKALLLAARPEFGPLQEEIMYMGKEVTVGKDFVEALYGITKHIRSDKLLKTVNVIASSIRSGGQLAPLLEQTSRNLRDQYFIEQKIRANIKMYIIFIFAAVGVGAPMLYALSTFLVEVLTGILSGIDIPPTAGLDLPLNLAKTSIDVGFVKAYVITAILVTAVMGSFIVGLIQRGSEREGFRYIPIIVALSLTVFFVVRFLIGQLLGGLFGP